MLPRKRDLLSPEATEACRALERLGPVHLIKVDVNWIEVEIQGVHFTIGIDGRLMPATKETT